MYLFYSLYISQWSPKLFGFQYFYQILYIIKEVDTKVCVSERVCVCVCGGGGGGYGRNREESVIFVYFLDAWNKYLAFMRVGFDTLKINCKLII